MSLALELYRLRLILPNDLISGFWAVASSDRCSSRQPKTLD